jgi:replicative DNA helicase
MSISHLIEQAAGSDAELANLPDKLLEIGIVAGCQSQWGFFLKSRKAGLQPDFFQERGCRLFYRAMCAWQYDQEQAPDEDLETFSEVSFYMFCQEQFEKDEVKEILRATSDAALSGDPPSLFHFERWVSHKIAKWKEAKERLVYAHASVMSHQGKGKEEIASYITHELGILSTIGQMPVNEDKALVDKVMESIEKRIQGVHQATLRSWGHSALDSVLGPIEAHEMVVIAARPSIGKSSFIRGMIDAALKAEDPRPSVLFSLEMSCEQVLQRMIFSRVGVTKRELKGINHHKYDEIQQAGKYYKARSGANLFIRDTETATIGEIQDECRKIRSEWGELRWVMIDYLQLINDKTTGNENDRIAAISRTVKLMTTRLGCPVIILSQLNRAVEKEDRRPRLSDLRSSGAIEQDADRVCFLHADHAELQKTVRNIIIDQAKGRDEGIFTCPGTFHGPSTSFLFNPPAGYYQ